MLKIKVVNYRLMRLPGYRIFLDQVTLCLTRRWLVVAVTIQSPRIIGKAGKVEINVIRDFSTDLYEKSGVFLKRIFQSVGNSGIVSRYSKLKTVYERMYLEDEPS